MTFLRSLTLQIAFYAVFTFWSLAALPFLMAPRRVTWRVLVLWSNSLRAVIRLFGIRLEVRGLEHLPESGCIIACKHQSAMETVTMLACFTTPAYIMKRELTWIPLFGWYARKIGMLPIDRARRSEALKALIGHARVAIAEGRQIVIYPEGTRRPVGVEPAYKYGVAHLYRELGCPVVPVALNTGLFWPRNTFWRYPGKAIVEFLPAIEGGLDLATFQARLVEVVESASDRLLLEALAEPDPPPLTPMAQAHVARITQR